jgi:D-alanyl-D-alanine carboxypeptidase
MRLMSAEACGTYRWTSSVLITVISLTVAMTGTADARKKSSRAQARAQATQSYNPPYAAIVVDAKTGSVLHQSSADGMRHPASLAKIMTLYLLFERLESGKTTPNTPMAVSEEAAGQPPTKLGLRAGGTLMVDDAIKALVTKSANDAAVVVAEALAGSEEEFAKLMTRKARSLGMRQTTYRNASGLPDDGQVTTARDQALLGIAIQERFPKFYRYFSVSKFAYRGNTLQNHNKLLGKVEGVDGIKTGYTRASGFNLVTSVKRDARQIVAVVLGGRTASTRDTRMRELIGNSIKFASTKSVVTPTARSATTDATTDAVAIAAISAAQNEQASASGSDTPMKPIRVKTVNVKAQKPEIASTLGAVDASTISASADATLESRLLATAFGQSEPAGSKQPSFNAVEARHPTADKPARIAALKETVLAPDKSPPTGKSTAATELSPIRGGWAVQVGAYEAEGEAKQHLTSAKVQASLLAKAKAYIERTVNGTKTYYRVRFAGFDRDQALAACKELKRKDIACVAVKI